MSKQNLIDQLQSRIDGDLSVMTDTDLMLLSINSNAYLVDLDVTALQTEVDVRLALLDAGSDYEQLTVANNQLRGLNQRFSGPEIDEFVALNVGPLEPNLAEYDGRTYLKTGVVSTDIDDYPLASRGFGLNQGVSYDLNTTAGAATWWGITGNDDPIAAGDVYYYTWRQDDRLLVKLDEDFAVVSVSTAATGFGFTGMSKAGQTMVLTEGSVMRSMDLDSGSITASYNISAQGQCQGGVIHWFDQLEPVDGVHVLVNQSEASPYQTLKRYEDGIYQAGKDIDLSEILGSESIIAMASARYDGVCYIATASKIYKLNHQFEVVGVTTTSSATVNTGGLGIDVANGNLITLNSSEVVQMLDTAEHVGSDTELTQSGFPHPLYVRIK